MAVQARSRPVRTSGGQFAPASKQERPHHNNKVPTFQPPPNSLHTTRDAPSPSSDDIEPPAKRRKLSIRGKQSTLDNFAIAQSGPPKPPTRVSVAQPHGKLVETVNGVRSVLDVDEDELSQPHSGASTPKPIRLSRAAVQPATAPPAKQEDKRTLRSQDDGPKLKSELAIYFPNYEDVIFDAPKESELITVDTAIYVTDDAPKPTPEHTSPGKSPKSTKAAAGHARTSSVNGVQPPTALQRSGSNQFNGSPSLNLDLISRTLPDHPGDPLTDEHYLKSHRRAERKEKQLRNIEKERAMHEKVQLDRLLDGLQGHDWLKVLGITGITDGEAKKYEQKRDYFIAEVQALVDKFKQWKEQERKQRLGREAAVAVKDDVEDEESPEGSVEPPSSDINASAARQLQQETVSALKSSKPSKGKGPLLPATPRPMVTFAPVPSPEVPITSFYEKRHLRDAALGKARHGRSVTAFGHPVPEMDEREFELPYDIETEDFLRANARERRARKRRSIANATST